MIYHFCDSKRYGFWLGNYPVFVWLSPILLDSFLHFGFKTHQNLTILQWFFHSLKRIVRECLMIFNSNQMFVMCTRIVIAGTKTFSIYEWQTCSMRMIHAIDFSINSEHHHWKLASDRLIEKNQKHRKCALCAMNGQWHQHPIEFTFNGFYIIRPFRWPLMHFMCVFPFYGGKCTVFIISNGNQRTNLVSSLIKIQLVLNSNTHISFQR